MPKEKPRDIYWREIGQGIIADHPDLPDGVKEPARQLVAGLMGVVSQIVGNLELVWLRGQQDGYEKGYADAKAGKPNRWDD